MIQITSPDFQDQENLPARFTCDGVGVNPALSLTNIPPNTQSLVLIVDDPDAPAGTFTHWLVWNLDPHIKEIKSGELPAGASVGLNSGRQTNYYPPCPPSGTHRYFFQIFALDTRLSLPAGSSRDELEKACQNHIVDQAVLVGFYSHR